MTDPHPETRPEAPHPAPPAPSLTYRDLQRAIFLSAALFLVYQLATPLATLLLFFLLVFILASVLNPIAVRLERVGVPRVLSAACLAVLVPLVGAVALWLLLPPLLDETRRLIIALNERQQELFAYYQELVRTYPELAEQLPPPSAILEDLTPRVTALMGQVGRYTVSLAAGLVSLALLLVLVVFTVAAPRPLLIGFLSAVPERHRDRVATATRRILTQMKYWAFGSMFLGLLVGIATGVGLHLLGVPYALLFGVVAGLGELIPTVGPIIAAIPPLTVAIGMDPMLGLWVGLLVSSIQAIENFLIVPLVRGKTLNLHPVSLIFTVLVMGATFGVLGAFLAVPVCVIVKVCWEEFYLLPRQTDAGTLRAAAEAIVSNDSPERWPVTVLPGEEGTTGGAGLPSGVRRAPD
jgi:putative permease